MDNLVLLVLGIFLSLSLYAFVLLLKLHVAMKMFPPVNALDHSTKTLSDVEGSSGVRMSDEGFAEMDEEAQFSWMKEQIGEQGEKELREIFVGEKEDE